MQTSSKGASTALGGLHSRSQEWLALAPLALAMLLASLGTSIANVALPTLATAFAASFQSVQWIVIAYLLAVTSLIVGVARIGDVAGRKRVFLGGILLFTAASALCGSSQSLALLVAARVAQGAGAAAMMALAMAFVADTAPPGRTGTALGMLGAVSAAGTALGPVLGGLLIAAVGWPAIFIVNVPLGLAALLLAWRHLPADASTPAGAGRGFDYPGMALLAGTLAAFALAMTLGRGEFGLLNLALLACAGLGAALFLRVEARIAIPLIDATLLRKAALGAKLGANLLVAAVMMTTLVVGPFYLSGGLGLGAATAGLALSAAPLVVALAATPAGRLSDRCGAERVSLFGLAAIAGGCAAFASLPATFGLAGYLLPTALVAAGYALFQTANNALVLNEAPSAQRGIVSALLNLSRNLGLIAGAAAMGALFRLAIGTGDVSSALAADIAFATRATYGAAAVLGLCALAAVSMPASARRPGFDRAGKQV